MTSPIWEYTHCALCGCDDARPKYAAQDWLHHGPDQFHFVQCRRCSLVYLNPRPAAASILNYYPADYTYAPGAPSTAPGAPIPLRQKLFLSLLAHYYGFPIAQPDLPRLIRPYLGLYHQLYRTITLPVIPWRPDGRILDVGCGKGDYLAGLKRLGWHVHGVELNPHAVQYARQQLHLDIFEGNFLESHFPSGHFDVVTMWWYLEHVPNPVEILQEARRVLKRDGWLWLGVPNCESLEARVFGEAWYHLDAPRHLYLFTPATLAALLGRAGLRITRSHKMAWLNDPAQSVERWLEVRWGLKHTFPKALRLALAPLGWLEARLGLSSFLVIRAEPGSN